MAFFDLHDIKRKASFFCREKLNDARLAFTDVSRTQLLTEEATNADPWGPETRTMAMLSDAAYELEEYERIVRVLHSRLETTEKRPWRQVHKTLVVLEYLLMHGPGSLCNEFRCNILRIEELCQFNFIDQQGIDRGLSIRKKADRVLELLNETELWKEERNRALKISHGIKGFGSSIKRETSPVEVEISEHEDLTEDSRVEEEAVNQSTPLLLDEAVKEERRADANVSKISKAEGRSYEKKLSVPLDFRQSESMGSPSNKEIEPESSKYKKSLSSPCHFREKSEVVWQPFGHKTSETIDSEAQFGDSSRNTVLDVVQDYDQELVTDGKRRDVLQEVQQNGRTKQESKHVSVRRLIGLHRSNKPWGSSEKHAKQESVAATKNSASSSGGNQDLGAKLPALPPPPRPKFGASLQSQVQPPSLI